ncbi:hypothetical protein EHQ81_18010 [Leptospira selangorensis]|uniref:Porin n=1 Tax=Leptospira selangorensis TaxID=2484982 RepID=A0A5F2C539_9LEPT|nr:hypothetical protein [Leptospira selangorensis]TGM11562.1 hypothetical protein EHQ81_18010 [Leptospira selangorensis]TGM21211.1 hypothetical protein EHQ82_09395 [Leptospira selangorensis]
MRFFMISNFRILLSLFLFFSFVGPNFSQEPEKTEQPPSVPKQEETAKETSSWFNDPNDKFSKVFEHRLMFRVGAGIGNLSPAILNETGPAWSKDSILRNIVDADSPPSFPYKEAKSLGVQTQAWDISYGWKNRFEIQSARNSSLGKYGKEEPASTNFITPRTDLYWASAFEGNRLLRFDGISDHLRFSYIHPFTSRFRIGPSVNFHRYTEQDTSSYGSYSTSRPGAPVPDKATWSVGGNVESNFSMKGILPGIYLKFKITEWWEIRSRLEYLDRKGDFSAIGIQVLQESISGGPGTYSISVPAYGGKVSDKGTIFMFESSFRYCRFSLDIGMIRQDITRSYSMYVGDTIGTVSTNDYLLRFPNIDLGQISHHSKQTLTEVYIMPGASFFYDSDGIY